MRGKAWSAQRFRFLSAVCPAPCHNLQGKFDHMGAVWGNVSRSTDEEAIQAIKNVYCGISPEQEPGQYAYDDDDGGQSYKYVESTALAS
jgi:hypothetical protein